MPDFEELAVTVRGDLPDDVMTGICGAVQRAVLEELATQDLAPESYDLLRPGQESKALAGGGSTMGIVLRRPTSELEIPPEAAT